MKSCISNNSKTYNSVDFTTNCPKRQEGNPCKYCYVEAARKLNFNAKLIYNTTYNKEVLKFSKIKIKKLNAMGGIRLFSFGDYMEINNSDIFNFLSDCQKVGLKVKVITKQTAFIDTFYHFFKDVFSIIHLSIDTIENGVDIDTAMAYKNTYKKVIIRSVILWDSDLDKIADISDIITFNHGNNGFYNYNLHKKEKEALIERYNIKDKTCCSTGKCETCPIKCKAQI